MPRRRRWIYYLVLLIAAAIGSPWIVPLLTRDRTAEAPEVPKTTQDTAVSAPSLVLSATSLAFEVLSGPQEFTVRNSGGGALEYQLASDASWLVLTPSSGSSAGEPRTVRAEVNWEAIGYGGHTAVITVTPATGASRSIAVTAAALPEPCFVPGSLRFDAQTGAQVVSLWNCGSAELEIALSTSANCLTVRPATATVSTERIRIEVAVDASGLPQGQRAELITVRPRVGTAKTIPVTITVLADPSAPKEPAVLFQDRFASGRSPAWAVSSGNWTFENGYCSFSSAAMSGTTGTMLLPMGTQWSDYRVEADVYMPPADVSQAAVGLIVRAQPDLDSWVLAGGSAGKVGLYVRSGGNTASKQEVAPGLFVGWQHVAIEIRGSTCTLYVNGIKRCELTDTTYQKGMPGLLAWDAWKMIDFDRLGEPRTLLIDNFTVTSL